MASRLSQLVSVLNSVQFGLRMAALSGHPGLGASPTSWAETSEPVDKLVFQAQAVGRELVTSDQEVKWASRSAFANSTYSSQINPRLERLCKELGGSALKLQPILEEREAINAKAVGGGLILVTEGLVHRLDRAAQAEPGDSLGGYLKQHNLSPDDILAAVLAHEVAHIESRDLAANWGQQVLAEQLGVLATQSGPQSGLLMELPEALQKANWETEFQADAKGAKLLQLSGRDPKLMQHMLRALQIMAEERGRPQHDGEHPPLLERLARLG